MTKPRPGEDMCWRKSWGNIPSLTPLVILKTPKPLFFACRVASCAPSAVAWRRPGRGRPDRRRGGECYRALRGPTGGEGGRTGGAGEQTAPGGSALLTHSPQPQVGREGRRHRPAQPWPSPQAAVARGGGWRAASRVTARRQCGGGVAVRK